MIPQSFCTNKSKTYCKSGNIFTESYANEFCDGDPVLVMCRTPGCWQQTKYKCGEDSEQLATSIHVWDNANCSQVAIAQTGVIANSSHQVEVPVSSGSVRLGLIQDRDNDALSVDNRRIDNTKPNTCIFDSTTNLSFAYSPLQKSPYLLVDSCYKASSTTCPGYISNPPSPLPSFNISWQTVLAVALVVLIVIAFFVSPHKHSILVPPALPAEPLDPTLY